MSVDSVLSFLLKSFLPSLFFRWLLPRGHYVLVEKYRVPRGEEHSLEAVPDVPYEDDEWKRHQERLKMVKAALQPRAPVEDEEQEEAEEEGSLVDSEEDEDLRQDVAPVARMVGPLDTAMREQETALGDLRDYVAATKLPEHISEFEDCHDRQLDCPLVDLDFVVELMEGKAFRGLPYLERYGSADAKPCLCGAPSVASLLKNASEAESCVMARRSFQGSYSTLCPECLQRKRDESERATAALRELLSVEERDVVVLMRFRDDDAEGRLRAYRVFNWMLARGVDVRVEHFEDLPRFVLKDIFQLKLLTDALDKDAKGTLVHAQRGVCVPHFTDPLDEALSTMEGTRSFMQTLQSQKFSAIKGMKKELLACFRERNSMHIMDGVDEALVGSTSMERWQEESDGR